jgi:hypothetical protein
MFDVLVDCPVAGCNQACLVMEGTYDFDAQGRATALVAPQWSRDALEAIQAPLAQLDKVLASPVSNAELNTRVDEILDAIKAQGTELAQQVATGVETNVKGKPRRQGRAWVNKAGMFVGGILTEDIATATYPEHLVKALARHLGLS